MLENRENQRVRTKICLNNFWLKALSNKKFISRNQIEILSILLIDSADKILKNPFKEVKNDALCSKSLLYRQH